MGKRGEMIQDGVVYRPVIEQEFPVSCDSPARDWKDVTLYYREDSTGACLLDSNGIAVHEHFENLEKAMEAHPEVDWRDPGNTFPPEVVKVGRV